LTGGRRRVSALSYNRTLKCAPSTLFRQDINGEWERLGNGLFTTVDIPANTDICFFFGDLKRPEDANKHYSIQINQTLYLDCYNQMIDGNNHIILMILLYYYFDNKIGICMASLANSPFKAFVNKKTSALSNCHLVVYPMGRTAKLRTGKKNKIKAGSEIVWYYNSKYIYPPQFN
jgi:hypothetical protein